MRFSTRFWSPTIPLETLSLFCGNLATCLTAGLGLPKSLRVGQPSSCPVLKQIAQEASKRVEAGEGLFEALEPGARHFPAFFLPAIRCGERSGRIDDTLRYLEQHCRLLAGPVKAMRNLWLYPLCIMLAGSVICLVGYLALAPFWTTLGYLRQQVTFYGLLLGAAWCVVHVASVKATVDRLRLALPWLGQAERELAMNRFFHAMSLLYATSGCRVETMIRLAAESTGNEIVAADFLHAAAVIEAQGTIGDAFRAVPSLPHDYVSIVAAGDAAGKLETAFDTVSRYAGATAQSQVAMLQQILSRLVMFTTILSLMSTLSYLLAIAHAQP